MRIHTLYLRNAAGQWTSWNDRPTLAEFHFPGNPQYHLCRVLKGFHVVPLVRSWQNINRPRGLVIMLAGYCKAVAVRHPRPSDFWQPTYCQPIHGLADRVWNCSSGDLYPNTTAKSISLMACKNISCILLWQVESLSEILGRTSALFVKWLKTTVTKAAKPLTHQPTRPLSPLSVSALCDFFLQVLNIIALRCYQHSLLIYDIALNNNIWLHQGYIWMSFFTLISCSPSKHIFRV